MVEVGASANVVLEAINSKMGEERAYPKVGLNVAKWSIVILVHSITALKRFLHGDDLAGQLLQLAEQLQLVTFQKRAGCLEASCVLRGIVRMTQSNCLNAALAFLDFAKPFDTVSINTIIRVAAAHGDPPELQHSLRALYTSSKLLLDDEVSDCHRGVRQGDQLFPLFFIMVSTIAATLPDRGATIWEEIGALAYAHNLVLFAFSQEALSVKLRALQHTLSATGVEEELCEAESRKLREIDADGQRLCSQLLWAGRSRRFGTTSEGGSSLEGLQMGFSLSQEPTYTFPGT
ncbi:unnamed protein product [Dicrocoelium dendriticum]|nr:unnamed protein product [Dicrocoelium dendriticum]